MNLNKVINIALVIIPASLAGGVLAIASVSTISFINNAERPKGLFPYNELVTNFSESNDPIDKKALSIYQNSTVSLQYTLGGGTWHFGTAWYWGQKNSTHSYYATNLHVVDSLLVYNSSSSLDYAKRFSFNPRINGPNFNFQLHYQSYDNDNDNPNLNPTFEDVQLEKVNMMNSNSVPEFKVIDKHLYSDLVIFSTSTILPNLPTWNFIDNFMEISDVLTYLPKLTFYIAGFPYHDKPTWTTGKYKWKADNDMKGYNTPPGWATAAGLFSRPGNNYFDSDSGLSVNALGLTTNAERHHYSYSRQVILPGLNLSGGSSGSLVTVLNEQTGELQPLGIYWGVYQGYISNDPENPIYQGGLDLFFSGAYKLQSSSQLYNYNNTII